MTNQPNHPAGDDAAPDAKTSPGQAGLRAEPGPEGSSGSSSQAPRVAVVGYPNAGKSTLINRLVGGRQAVVHSEPGVTRDRKELPCDWNGVHFVLIDTGGVDLASEDSLSASIQQQALSAIEEAQAVLFVVDARTGVEPGDAELAKLLRAAPVPVLVVANKIDQPASEYLAAELHQLGVGEVWPVSAAHGHGTGDLLDALVGALAELAPASGSVESDEVGVAIIGRPNVGKSSLLNAVLRAERVIVSDQAGTTRDAIDVEFDFEGRRLRLIDTAGLRRRTKVAGTVAYYAQLRSERAAERADVALLVTDATEGIRTEDLRIGELAMRTGCATLVALNKWDLTTTDLEDARARVEKRLRQRPPLITCSALTKRNLPGLLRRAIELADRRAERIRTPELNRFLADVVATTPPPAVRGRRLRLYYVAQIGERPPRFAIQVNDRGLIKREWAFHLENRLREAYGLEGVPVVIDYIPRSRSRSERRPRSAARS